MTETKRHILKQVLLDAGLTEGQAETIGLLFLRKSERQQDVLYYRMMGLKHREIAEIVGCSQPRVTQILKSEKKLKSFLKRLIF